MSRRLLGAAEAMVRACGADVPPADNPGVALGAVLGTLAAKAGRDKVTIVASPGIADFGAWLEQLLAESTGKQGKGLIPVDGEPLGRPSVYGADRLFAYLRLGGAADAGAGRGAGGAGARRPSGGAHRHAPTAASIGQEFFRWEIATAVAGAVIGINPFDQPDVEASKIKTRELTAAYEKTGELPPETPLFERSTASRSLPIRRNAKALRRPPCASIAGRLARARISGALGRGDYAALLAYVERNARASCAALQEIRAADPRPQARRHLPRLRPALPAFDRPGLQGRPEYRRVPADHRRRRRRSAPCPGADYSFGVVKAAQARGDFDVLAERGRRALRVHLGADVAAGLAALQDAVGRALA